jgi:hypothetical protein
MLPIEMQLPWLGNSGQWIWSTSQGREYADTEADAGEDALLFDVE